MTDGRLWTRSQILDKFRLEMGAHMDGRHVDGYLKRYFADEQRRRVVPTDTIPYPPLVVPDDVEEPERSRMIHEHENDRARTRKSRELFDIDHLPHYLAAPPPPKELTA